MDLIYLAAFGKFLNPNMATDAQSLLTQAKCFMCYGVSLYEGLKLALLAQISVAHNASNNTDPAFLLSTAQCFDCYGRPTIGQLFELALLQQIAT